MAEPYDHGMFHGRVDLSSPLGTAWELARAWPDAELVVIDDSGHTGSAAMTDAILEALDRFAEPTQNARA